MNHYFKRIAQTLFLLSTSILSITLHAQTLPGDTIVYGPMFSPVYNGSVRAWVLTSNSGNGNQLSLEVKSEGSSSITLAGKTYNSDTRLGYMLRSFEYTGLVNGETYRATVKVNGKASERTALIKNDANTVSDFSFLSGGCGRIYDTSRCIDRPESLTHKNGDPAIFNRMATEKSDMMVWLGDATYLLGLQHAGGQCPDGIDDWANKDTAFARYMFYRKFHDKLTMAMPQLAITDNHDTGPNEFNKTMPTLSLMKEIFMDWWPNPQYLSTQEGKGLFSSYKYKDIEYFLLDNRSYRNSTVEHLGPEQLEWLKKSLLASTATFKILVSGTPVFDKRGGGRNFSITTQANELINYIQDNNIDGVIALSADIHEQLFYGRYSAAKYPLFDILSGNLNSDIGDGNFSVDYNSDAIMHGTKQTYLKISLLGAVNDRRMKVQYVDLNGNPYFESIIHADMLKSKAETTQKISLAFSNNFVDASKNNFYVQGNPSFGLDRNGKSASAAVFNNSEVKVVGSSIIGLQDRTFSVSVWVKPTVFGADGSVIFSNANTNKGFTLGLNKEGYLQFIDHATGAILTSSGKLVLNQWTNIIWKYDNVKRILSLYNNGIFSQQWTGVVSPVNSAAEISLGNNFQNKPFLGALDDIELNGKLLSEDDIKKIAEYKSTRSSVLTLDGAQSMVISADAINPALAGDFTIEFWARLKADPGTNYKLLASNSRVDGNSTGLSFEFPDSNRLNLVIGNNSSSWSTISEKGEPWKVGEWNHVAVSATKNASLVYYVNGEKLGETAFGSYIANPTGLGLGDSPFYGGDVQAELEELKIWNAALDQASIKKHMSYQLTGAEDHLIFYYDFNASNTASVTSKGSNKFAIPLSGAKVSNGTAPVVDVSEIYKNSVAANWSVKNIPDNGFYLNDAINDVNANLVVGKEGSQTLLHLASDSSIAYINTGWVTNPSNISSGTININLTKILSALPAVTNIASTQYFLLQGDVAGNVTKIAGGKNIGNGIIQFTNVPLQNSVYHIGWLDTNTQAFSLMVEAENYSNMLGVSSEATTDAGGGKNVGWIDNGDWMAFNNIVIPVSGNYKVEYRVAGLYGGKLSLDINGGTTTLGSVDIPKTSGWQSWTTISHTVYIPAGTYSFGLFAQTGGWNINWWRIRSL